MYISSSGNFAFCYISHSREAIANPEGEEADSTSKPTFYSAEGQRKSMKQISTFLLLPHRIFCEYRRHFSGVPLISCPNTHTQSNLATGTGRMVQHFMSHESLKL